MVHRSDRKNIVITISEETKEKVDSIVENLREQNPLLTQSALLEKKELLLLMAKIDEQVASASEPKYNSARFFTKAMEYIEQDRDGLLKSDTLFCEAIEPLKIKKAFIKKIRAITDKLKLLLTPQSRIAFEESLDIEDALAVLEKENAFFYIELLIKKLHYRFKIHTLIIEDKRITIGLLGSQNGKNDIEVFLVLPRLLAREKYDNKI